MGYYTELLCKIKLKKETPDSVILLLKRVLIDRDLGNEREIFTNDEVFVPELEHDFFKCQRWFMLFLSTNWGDISGGKFYNNGKYWIIDLHTEFKNYDGEIEYFINWISPFIVGRKSKEFLGWWQGEDMRNRINIYINR